jgi:hypothetical protein
MPTTMPVSKPFPLLLPVAFVSLNPKPFDWRLQNPGMTGEGSSKLLSHLSSKSTGSNPSSTILPPPSPCCCLLPFLSQILKPLVTCRTLA